MSRKRPIELPKDIDAVTLRDYFRRHPRISQGDLARAVGYSQAMVSLVVNGKRRPSVDEAVALAKATGMWLDAVLKKPRRRPGSPKQPARRK